MFRSKQSNNQAAFNTDARERRKSSWLTIGCFLSGLAILVASVSGIPKLHRALAMQDSPTPITWHSLLSDPLPKNAFVEISGVEFDRTARVSPIDEITSAFENTSESIKNTIPNGANPDEFQHQILSMQKEVADQLGLMPVSTMFKKMTEGIMLFPVGQNPNQGPALLALPRSEKAIELASRQLDETRVLRGFLRRDNGQTTRRLLELITNGDARQRNAQQWKECIEKLLADQRSQSPSYIIEPMTERVNATNAGVLFGCALVALAIGIVMIGSATPGLFACLFMLPVVLFGLLGVPLRGGRGGRKTRFLYRIVGITLVAFGAYTIAMHSNFGVAGGYSISIYFGFVSAAMGLAALIGASANNRSALDLTEFIPAKPVSQQIEQERVSYRYGSTESPKTDSEQSEMDAIRYEDPLLVAEVSNYSNSLTYSTLASLSELGFDAPITVSDTKNFRASLMELSFGMNHTVFAEVTDDGNRACIRLSSILQDGLVVVTISNSVSKFRKTRFGENGVYQSSEGDETRELVMKHLKLTIDLSEKRGCSIITFDLEEKTEACLITRRVLADLSRQFENANVDVPRQSYGRFYFPPQTVCELAAI